MVGRKLSVVRNGQMVESYHLHPFIPDLHKIRRLAFESIKKYGHLSLIVILRSYIKSSNFLKNKYNETKIKIKNINRQKIMNGERQEISKFLKVISDYKHKIREIKHRIHEEERNS